MADEHSHDDHGPDDHGGHVNYIVIFGALCVLTVLSVLFDLGKDTFGRAVLASLVLGVAVLKASFVLLYFMHLKFEGPWKWALLAPTTVLAMALPFALAPDISYHYYFISVPQTSEAVRVVMNPEGEGHHSAGPGQTPTTPGTGEGDHPHGDAPAQGGKPAPGHGGH